jgi:hypothetical protein
MHGLLQLYRKLQKEYKTNVSNVKTFPFTHARICLVDNKCKNLCGTSVHKESYDRITKCNKRLNTAFKLLKIITVLRANLRNIFSITSSTLTWYWKCRTLITNSFCVIVETFVKKPRICGLMLLPETDLHTTYINLNLVHAVVMTKKRKMPSIATKRCLLCTWDFAHPNYLQYKLINCKNDISFINTPLITQ